MKKKFFIHVTFIVYYSDRHQVIETFTQICTEFSCVVRKISLYLSLSLSGLSCAGRFGSYGEYAYVFDYRNECGKYGLTNHGKQDKVQL